jgi:hypothetical protein
VIKRNINTILWRFAVLLGCILAGVIIGEGLRLFGLIGQVLFWLIIGFHTIVVCFLFVVMFSIWRDGKFSSYQGGSLNEYVWLSLLFDSGMIPGLWTQSTSLSENSLVIVLSALSLVTAIFVFTIS